MNFFYTSFNTLLVQTKLSKIALSRVSSPHSGSIIIQN